MGVIQISIPGEIVAKGRPRATTIGGRARLYTPARTQRYEDRVALCAFQAMQGRAVFDAPLQVSICLCMPIPKSWPKKRQAEALAGLRWPAVKPDIDNAAKSVCDALNGVVWRDDSLIVDLRVVKRYADAPRVDLVVTEMQG